MSLRSGLFAMAFVFAGTLAFIVVALCTAVLLANGDCGAAFNYLGCSAPATASNEGHQVALLQRRGARGKGTNGIDPVAFVAKARAYFLNEVLRQ